MNYQQYQKKFKLKFKQQMKFIPSHYHQKNKNAIKTSKKKKKTSASNRNPKESVDLQKHKMY